MWTIFRISARFARGLVGALFLAALMVAPAMADGYPDRPIHLVVPFPAGGGADTLARMIMPVITSYSIHYTKLYDVEAARERHDPGDRGVGLLQHRIVVGVDRAVRALWPHRPRSPRLRRHPRPPGLDVV